MDSIRIQKIKFINMLLEKENIKSYTEFAKKIHITRQYLCLIRSDDNPLPLSFCFKCWYFLKFNFSPFHFKNLITIFKSYPNSKKNKLK